MAQAYLKSVLLDVKAQKKDQLVARLVDLPQALDGLWPSPPGHGPGRHRRAAQHAVDAVVHKGCPGLLETRARLQVGGAGQLPQVPVDLAEEVAILAFPVVHSVPPGSSEQACPWPCGG